MGLENLFHLLYYKGESWGGGDYYLGLGYLADNH